MVRVTSLLLLLCAACGDDTSGTENGDAEVADVPVQDVREGDSASDASGPSSVAPLLDFYAEAVAWRVPEGQPVFGSDTTLEVEGRRIRVVEFGVGAGGFPTSDSVFDVAGRLFVEVDAAGDAVSNLDGVAVSIRAEADSSERGTRCALETGHACVVAIQHVLGPGRVDPPYINEVTGEPTADSTTLQFNLLREQERGQDASGATLPEPRVAREYVAHIARAGIYLLTATQEAIVRLSLSETPPTRFVVTGHSKWGGAAAQIAAFDPRVVGVFVSGWPLDWQRWLELTVERWNEGLGIEMFDFVCAEPCLWTSTREFLEYYRGSSGQVWLRQFDFRELQRAGDLRDVEVLALRNGREAHPVDTEARLFADGLGPSAFRFMPDEPHRFDTAEHGAVWRHWVRHSFDGLATYNVEDRLIVDSNDLTLDIDGQNIRQVVLATRRTNDGNFGALDGLPEYECAGECAWRLEPMNLEGGTATATLPDGPLAFVVSAQFDDGSGDLVTLSSQVRIRR